MLPFRSHPLLQTSPSSLCFGPYRLDGRARILLLDEQLVPLPARTVELLFLLMEHPGEIVSREEILSAIWQNAAVEDSNVTVHISQLRKTLARGLPGVNVIQTAPKKGYRFAVPVEAVSADARAPRTAAPPIVPPAQPKVQWWSTAAAIGAVLAALLLVTSSHRAPAGNAAFRILQMTTSGNAGYADISPDGKQLAYLDNSRADQTFWVRDIATQAQRMLLPPGGHCPPIFARDGGSLFTCHTAEGASRPDIVRVALNGGDRQVLVANALGPQGVSPNGRQFSFITYEDQEMRLWVADVDGRNRRIVKILKHPIRFGSTAWSPDSAVIAYWYAGSFGGRREGRIGAVRVADSSEVAVGKLHWTSRSEGLFIKWAADGNSLIVTGIDPDSGHWQIYELAFPGMSARRVTHDLADYADLSISGDSRRLVSTRTESSSHLWSAPGGDASHAVALTAGTALYQEPSWTPGGRVLYVSRGIWLLDPATGNHARIEGTLPDDHSPRISPDERTLIFVSERSGTPEIWKMPLEGGPVTRLTHEENCGDPQFSPDGQWVVYDSYVRSELTVNRMPIGGGAPVRVSPATRIWHPSYSPDGKWLAVYWRPYRLDDSAQVQILPAGGGAPVVSFHIGRFAGFQVEWTADGRMITWMNQPDSGVSNIWGAPIAGGPPRQLTDFRDGQITSFGWSARGDLILARGTKRRDVVMLEEFLGR